MCFWRGFSVGNSQQLGLGAHIQWDERRQWPRADREGQELGH